MIRRCRFTVVVVHILGVKEQVPADMAKNARGLLLEIVRMLEVMARE